MEFEQKTTTDYYNPESPLGCEIVCIHVKITNIDEDVSSLLKVISDTSWIDRLGAIDKKIYNATSERTITDISEKIKAMDNSPLSVSVGEYLVSFSAQNALVEVCGHHKLPLAELLKEKKSGNPGFDFHTISSNNLLIFGEAKYSANNTPKDKAIEQIMDFIGLKKDYAELHSLLPLLSEEVKSKIVDDVKGYAAAFSLNMNSLDLAFKNAFKMNELNNVIAEHSEYYIIAVEIC